MPALAFGCCPVHLNEPCEVHAVRKRVGNCADVAREAVSGDLEILARRCVAQTFDEDVRGGLIPFAKGEV